ncbi:MAG TPA: hypothetical protein VMW94_01975, partial [Actinomycetes bacterium]|nr:hypothetical protein [Actinomycetes bacterium]
AGGTLQISLAMDVSGEGPVPMLVVDPPDDPPGGAGLVETSRRLHAGLAADVDAAARFGSLELVDVTGELLLAAPQMEIAQWVDPQWKVSSWPPVAGARYVAVTVDNEMVGGATVSDTGTIDFGEGATVPEEGAKVIVEYLGPDVDPANPAERAGVEFSLNADELPDNSYGAVPLTDLWAAVMPHLEFSGMVAGSLSPSVLDGDPVADAVSVLCTFRDLLHPQISVRKDVLKELFANVDFDLLTIISGIEAFLGVLEDGLTSKIISSLPLVGSGFDAAGTFIGKLRTELVTPLADKLRKLSGNLDAAAEEIRKFVYDALASMNMVDDDSDVVVGLDDEADVVVELDTEHLEIRAHLHGEDLTFVGFGTGLAGLPITADGGVEFGWEYDVRLGVGVDRFEGVYFVADPGNPEVKLTVDAHLALDESVSPPVPTSVRMNVLGLELMATDNGDTRLGGEIALNLVPTSGDLLYLSDLLSQPFGEVFTIAEGSEAGACVDLHLSAAADSELPSIFADLFADWSVSIETVDGDIQVSISQPCLAFQDISLDLGGFLSRTIGSVVVEVYRKTEPVADLIDLLLKRVPGISDASELAGRGEITFVDLAFLRKPEAGAQTKQLLRAIQRIRELGKAMVDFGEENVVVNLGSFTIGGENHPDQHLDSDAWRTEEGVEDTLAEYEEDYPDVESDATEDGGGKIASFFRELRRSVESSGLGISLDFLDAKNILYYFLGIPADVVTWDIPRLELSFGWE